MLARALRWGSCLLGFWLLAPVASAATGGNELFTQGVGAFKSGDFASALRYFQQAQSVGLHQPALYYNLGVSLYKLGRYAEAEDAFRTCARDRAWASLASYNAGLSAYRRGRRAAAAEYFERAYLTADSDKVRALALTMLERSDPVAGRRGHGTLALNFGYNDNVTLAAAGQTLQASSESDRFSELIASATGRWRQSAQALRWDTTLYDLRYPRLTDNTITSVALGVSKPTTIAPWFTAIGAQWEDVLRDGQRFQQITSLRLVAVRDRPQGRDLRLSLQLSHIDALDDNFAFLDGSQQQFNVSVAQPLAGGQTRLGVVLERNDRADLATTNEFFSFSPSRYGLWFRGSWPLGAYWRLEPGGRYTHSRYADADRRASGVVATREDDERELALRARYRLTAVWRLLGEFSYVDNRSNFTEFAYTQRVVWIGASRSF